MHSFIGEAQPTSVQQVNDFMVSFRCITLIMSML